MDMVSRHLHRKVGHTLGLRQEGCILSVLNLTGHYRLQVSFSAVRDLFYNTGLVLDSVFKE